MLSQEVIEYSVVVFLTQIVFLWSRTWNVKAIARNEVNQAMISGAIVHITWLLSISLGVTSVNEIIRNFDITYLPVVVFSLVGGLLGTYWSMKSKRL